MRFGAIGWGLRGKLAGLAHKPEKDQHLTVLADTREIARSRFLEAYPAATAVEDYRTLLDQNLDAVFVMTPDHMHEEHATPFLEAGIPVFLEKPMSISIESCDRIREAAEKHGTKLYVGHNMRHFGVIRKMKEWIDKGMIGEVKTAWCRQFVSYGGDAYFRDWHADRRNTTGLLLQKGAHDIDVLHWLTGGYSQEVTAFGELMVYGGIQDRQSAPGEIEVEFRKTWPPRTLDRLNPVVDVEDVSMMLMKLDNGVLASYQHCMFAPDAWRNYTIIGTEGRIENFGDAPGKAIVKLWDHARYEHDPEGDLSCRIPDAAGTHGGSDPRMVDEFVEYVKNDGPTASTPYSARMAVAAGVAATHSLRNGGVPVRV